MIPYDVVDAFRTFARSLNNEGVKPVARTAQEMRQLAENLMMKAAWLDSIPENDPFKNDTILKFDVVSRGRTFTYAALRAADRWWLTGRNPSAPQGFSWASLIGWMREHDRVTTIQVMQPDYVLNDQCSHPLATAQGRVGEAATVFADEEECQCSDHQANRAKIAEHAGSLRNFFNPKADFVDTYPEGHEVPE